MTEKEHNDLDLKQNRFPEDFEKFMDGLQQAIQYIECEGNVNIPLSQEENTDEIKIDIDF